MGISLKNLLGTEFFSNSRVLAGEKGIYKKVNSVTVIDSPEGVKWLKGGELALTTAYSIKDDEKKQVEMIEELERAKSSGLGIKLRYLNNTIPDKMKMKADELGFTIFQVDETYSWLDIISFIMFGTEIQGMDLSSNTRRKYRGKLLNDLLESKFNSFDEAYIKFKELGWNLHKINHVLLVKILGNRLNSLNNRTLDEFKKTICGVYDESNLVFILPNEGGSIHASVKEIKSTLQNILGNDFQMGLGGSVEFHEINRSLYEAKRVIYVVGKDSSLKGVYDYRDIGFYRLLDFNRLNLNLEDYLKDYLGSLIYSEKENKDELLETLTVFLDNGCNFRDTAEKMYMHPNSIRYRIEVIEEMYGIDLNTSKDRINIAIALKLLSFLA